MHSGYFFFLSFCISKQKVSESDSSWCNIHYLPLKSQESQPLTLRCCLGIFWEELRSRQVFPGASNTRFLCKPSKSLRWKWHSQRCTPTSNILEERLLQCHCLRTIPPRGRKVIPSLGNFCHHWREYWLTFNFHNNSRKVGAILMAIYIKENWGYLTC